MKILSDFDGVLTDQTEEGHRVRAIFRERLASQGRLELRQVDELFAEVEAAMDAAPHRHGWTVLGRVTAFANEDLFIRNNGVAACLDGWARESRPRIKEIAGALRDRGVESFHALAQNAYEAMVRETQAGEMKPIDPATPKVIGGLLDRGHEVVVVSNSGTDRILDLFSRAGLQAVAHDADPEARLRIRGGARKFELAERASGFDVGEYFVDVARPVYERIIREEKPACVIGDVFSLDLALPFHLARTAGPDFRGMKLFLRTRDYTPAWSRDFVAGVSDASASFHFLSELDELSAYYR